MRPTREGELRPDFARRPANPHEPELAGSSVSGWGWSGIGQQRYVLNNHEYGVEQVFVRPFRRDDQVFLRLTLVAYERIVDLLELEIPLPEELATRVERASEAYRPPSFRVYADSNIL